MKFSLRMINLDHSDIGWASFTLIHLATEHLMNRRLTSVVCMCTVDIRPCEHKQCLCMPYTTEIQLFVVITTAWWPSLQEVALAVLWKKLSNLARPSGFLRGKVWWIIEICHEHRPGGECDLKLYTNAICACNEYVQHRGSSHMQNWLQLISIHQITTNSWIT